MNTNDTVFNTDRGNTEETENVNTFACPTHSGDDMQNLLKPPSMFSVHGLYAPESGERKLIFCRVADSNGKKNTYVHGSGKEYHCEQTVWEYGPGEIVGLVADEHTVYDVLTKADTELFYRIQAGYKPEKLFLLYSSYLFMRLEQRQYIQSCVTLGYPFDSGSLSDMPVCVFNGIEELRVKFALTKDTYPPETRKYIETLFEQRKEKAFGKANTEIDERLKYLVNITCRYMYAVPFQREKLLMSLEQNLVGLNAIKKSFCDILNAELVYRKKRSCLSFLLVGASGTGKTTFARLLSESIGIPFFTISCAGISTAIPFVGDEAAFDHSSPGELVKKMYQYGGSSECVILLDEVDKMTHNYKEGNPYMALLDMLSESRHYDRYLETYVDMHRSIVVCTANYEENIPEVLLQRFTHVLHFPSYTNEEKAVIGAGRVKKLLQNYQLDQVSFTDRAMRRIAWYTDDDGMRKYNACVQKLVTSILSEGMTEGVIDEEYIDGHLSGGLENTNDYKLVFKRNELYYDAKIRDEIRKTLAMLESHKCSGESAAKYEEKLELLCRIYAKPQSQPLDINAIHETLMKSHFGMERVKRQISRFFYSNAVTGTISGGRILLCGEAGVGKTSITKAIAKALHRPLVAINLNGMEKPEVLKGFPMTYVDAAPGLLAREICRAGIRCVVRLDEMEKCSLSVQNALIDLLDSSNNFVDLFLGTGLNLSETIFVATVNNIELVTASLRDRFHEINLGDYTCEEKFQILRNYILPKLLSRYSLDDGSVLFDDAALRMLVRYYAKSAGVRELERELENYILDILQIHRGSITGKERCDCSKMQKFLEENQALPVKNVGFV